MFANNIYRYKYNISQTCHIERDFKYFNVEEKNLRHRNFTPVFFAGITVHCSCQLLCRISNLQSFFFWTVHLTYMMLIMSPADAVSSMTCASISYCFVMILCVARYTNTPVSTQMNSTDITAPITSANRHAMELVDSDHTPVLLIK